jgi:hypothetical protein
MCVLADVFQVIAHEGKRFVVWSPFQADQLFYRFRVKDIAADSVAGIGRVADDGTVVDLLNHRANQPKLRIVGVNFYDHSVQFDKRLASVKRRASG